MGPKQEGRFSAGMGDGLKERLKQFDYFYFGGLLILVPLFCRPYFQAIRFLLAWLPCMGVVILLLGFLRLGVRGKGKRHPLRQAYYSVLVLLILYFASLAMTTSSLLAERQRNPAMTGQDVIVLGVELSSDLDRAMLDHRLAPVVGYLRTYPQAKAILCGGIWENAGQSSAAYMAGRLIEAGIAGERLMLEEGSRDVKEAIAAAQAIVVTIQGSSQTEAVGLVSHEYQLHRARIYAGRTGLAIGKMCVATPADGFLSLNYFIREHPKVVLAWLGR